MVMCGLCALSWFVKMSVYCRILEAVMLFVDKSHLPLVVTFDVGGLRSRKERALCVGAEKVKLSFRHRARPCVLCLLSVARAACG